MRLYIHRYINVVRVFFFFVFSFLIQLGCITVFYLTTYLYLLRVCDPCIYPIRVPPLQKPLLCPEPMLMAIEKPHSKKLKKIDFFFLICCENTDVGLG